MLAVVGSANRMVKGPSGGRVEIDPISLFASALRCIITTARYAYTAQAAYISRRPELYSMGLSISFIYQYGYIPIYWQPLN